MKYFIILLAILFYFISPADNYSQFGWTKIYSDDTALGIYSMNSFKINGIAKRQIYIIRGINFNPLGNPNNSGKCLKYNETNGSWYEPANGFLNASWCFCVCPFTCNPPRFVCNIVLRYVISPLDTQMIIKNLMGGCGCDDGDVNHLTHDGGINFKNLPQFGNGFVGQLCFGFDIDPLNDDIIYIGYPIIGTSFKCVFKSTNKGDTWIAVDTNSFNNGVIKVNPLRRIDIFATSFSSMLLSTNSGADFINVGGAALSSIVFDYSDSSIYGLANGLGIYKSTNHGFNWTQVASGQFRSIEIFQMNHNVIYAGSAAGLHRSTNVGATWSLYNDSFNPSKTVIGISCDANTDTIYVATMDAVYKVYGGWVGISKISGEIPVNFSLRQNYPNPFNPMTNIKFYVAKFENIQIAVYDLTGREIEIVVNQDLNPGIYEVSFNAANLSSGVYFYRMIAGGRTIDSKRMIVSK